MAQGSFNLKQPAKKGGGRMSKKKAVSMKKGNLIRKPKRSTVAQLTNKQKKLSAAIGRNIERATGKMLSQNGGDLSLLKRVSRAVKQGGDESSANAATPKFDTRKQFKLTS